MEEENENGALVLCLDLARALSSALLLALHVLPDLRVLALVCRLVVLCVVDDEGYCYRGRAEAENEREEHHPDLDHLLRFLLLFLRLLE